MLFESAWRSFLLIVFTIFCWAVVVGIGKIGELFFAYLVVPINITWPLWLFVFLFFGVFFYGKRTE